MVIGVWHGAGWAFAIYGLIQGLLIMWERFTEKPRAAIQKKVPSALFKTVMVVRHPTSSLRAFYCCSSAL